MKQVESQSPLDKITATAFHACAAGAGSLSPPTLYAISNSL